MPTAAGKLKQRLGAEAAPPQAKKKPNAILLRTAQPAVRRRQPEQVLARIVEAATVAFTKDGFKGARLRSIAAEARISIQLLIYHAKTKEILWRMVMENILSGYENFAAQNSPLPASASAGDRLRRLIADTVHYTAQQPQLHRILTQEGAHMTPRLIWLIDNFYRKANQDFNALAEEAKRDGALRPEIDASRLRYAVRAMAAVPYSVSAEYEYLTGKSPFNRGEIAKTIELINSMIFVD